VEDERAEQVEFWLGRMRTRSRDWIFLEEAIAPREALAVARDPLHLPG